MDDLKQRLRNKSRLTSRDEEEAADRIEQLEANERAWLATNEDLQQAYQQATDRIERLERESDEDIRNCEKQLAARDHRIEQLEAALREVVKAWDQNDDLFTCADAIEVLLPALRALDGEDTDG